ncbi:MULTISPECIES: ion transporter [unclassified Streptomyces]|uniref:ion transporter n=1 Tax=unclassified Streptomyces TaxID=2593676 RepID=UPI000805A067|nr:MULTISPECIES: ion transporter [unclassified Streptomyces]MYR76859.1 ion transporter [Streptomyces sp. SID4925]SBU94815.1 voltage-gated sodium channel [Streptomyces sp. OspMP-M45]
MPEQHDRTTAVESRSDRLELARRCRRVTEARWFALTVLAVILLNAALLGLETYSGLVAEWHRWLRLAEHACLAVFTVEILLRLGAHADRPRNFCKDPWNLFDLAVVLCAFLPFVRENTTVLRLLRLARVLRTARFLPQLRIVLVAVGRSLPGTLSFLLVGALLLYVYAMVGWVFFGHQDPEHYGSIGRAVLTLFLLMILDGIGDAIHAGLEISRWSLLYYASYVLLASFVLVNVLVGVVITSLEEAREMEREEEPPEVPDPTPVPEDQRLLLERVTAARRALDALERDLTATALPPPTDHPRRDLAEEGAPS